MRHLPKASASLLSASLLFGLATFGSARTAHASSSFPEALQQALQAHFPGEAYCVPLCTACHRTTLGGPGDLNVFGTNLENHGFLQLGNGADQAAANAKVAKALETYLASTPGATDKQVNGKWDSDGDGVSDEDELKAQTSPSLFGTIPFCNDDLKYGCGARIASAPPPPIDRLGLFSAGLVVTGLALLRRRRRAAAK